MPADWPNTFWNRVAATVTLELMNCSFGTAANYLLVSDSFRLPRFCTHIGNVRQNVQQANHAHGKRKRDSECSLRLSNL